MLGCRSKRRSKLILLFLVVLAGCQTPPKPEAFEVAKPYAEVFNATKAHISKCNPNLKFRANLYTDIPEADIVVDYTPASTLIVTGYTAYSTVEKSRDLLNLHFKGVGQKTLVTSSTGNGRGVVISGLNNSPCPAIKK